MNKAPTCCPFCESQDFHKKGYYLVRALKAYRRRYLCQKCGKSFSTQTHQPTYNQKRPDLNQQILRLLVSGIPQRGIARILKCSKNTVELKIKWLGLHTKIPQFNNPKVLYIDEMESIEHTKLKPLTIPVAVGDDFKILSTQVGRIPAKGPLAGISVKKYGYRPSESLQTLRRLFVDLKDQEINPQVIRTDEAAAYKGLIKEFFPKAIHECFSSKEMIKKKREMVFLSQKKPYDPLFPINQRHAKLRADIRRLTRRSWCTTKLPENLALHLRLYQACQ
jgi:transposase-like protein/IS1 family transposase